MTTKAPNSDYVNEISIGDILQKLLRRVGLIFAFTLVGIFGGLTVSLLLATRTNPVVVYHVNLTGINKSTYPNGSVFSPQDLLSPEVLREIAKTAGIDNQKSLRQALNIEYNSPEAEGISVKYATQLSRRGLAAADIDQINVRYSDELKRSTESTLRLSFNTGELSIGVAQAKEILVEIPQTWSKIFTTRFRVLDDTRLPGATVEPIKELETGIGAINALKLLDTVQSGLTLFTADNRLGALQTKAGLNPADLVRQIIDLNEVYLSPITTSQLSKEDFYTKMYFRSLNLKIVEFDTELAGYRSTINDIRAIMDQQGSIQRDSLKAPDGSALQVDGSALGDIILLANQASLAEYLTGLFDKQQTLISKKAKLKTRINRSSADIVVSIPFIEQTQLRLNEIVASYNELLLKARSIIRSEFVVLYRPIGEPIEVRSGIFSKIVKISAGGLMLGFFLAFLIALVLPEKYKE